MKIIKDCNKCGKDYMYDINLQPQYKEFCQECVAKKMDRSKITKLAYLWRHAENYYLKTGSAWQKDRVYRIQKSLNLTKKEISELEKICWSMGV